MRQFVTPPIKSKLKRSHPWEQDTFNSRYSAWFLSFHVCWCFCGDLQIIPDKKEHPQLKTRELLAIRLFFFVLYVRSYFYIWKLRRRPRLLSRFLLRTRKFIKEHSCFLHGLTDKCNFFRREILLALNVYIKFFSKTYSGMFTKMGFEKNCFCCFALKLRICCNNFPYLAKKEIVSIFQYDFSTFPYLFRLLRWKLGE